MKTWGTRCGSIVKKSRGFNIILHSFDFLWSCSFLCLLLCCLAVRKKRILYIHLLRIKQNLAIRFKNTWLPQDSKTSKDISKKANPEKPSDKMQSQHTSTLVISWANNPTCQSTKPGNWSSTKRPAISAHPNPMSKHVGFRVGSSKIGERRNVPCCMKSN